MIFDVKKLYLLILSLCFIVGFSLSPSYAKYFHKQEYPMLLSFVQEPVHYYFSAGEIYTFEIPQTGYYAFQLWGAYGSSSSRWIRIGNYTETYDIGGLGGEVKATGYFEKGKILTIFIGTQGEQAEIGFNGGGNSGSDTGNLFYHFFGGSGGGATGVRTASGTIEDRILVAGGGGGASGGSLGVSGYEPGAGGNGGNMENLNGYDGEGEGSGHGGTQAEGGDGWQNGILGEGGDALFSGGGGGGGYFGGGGGYGSAGGGGGGSSYIADRFILMIPENLPGRDETYDIRDGYAIISFIGDEGTVRW